MNENASINFDDLYEADAMEYDQLVAMIEDFQNNRLKSDDQKISNCLLSGRRVVYEQVAYAYKLAIIMLRDTNKTWLPTLLSNAGLENRSISFATRKGANPWAQAVAVLYGKWVERTDDNGQRFLSFARDRSAEKYANVMRHLWENKRVKPEDAADFIQNYKSKHGNCLFGMEAADRARHSKKKTGSGSKRVLNHRDDYIRKGEAVDGEQVFYAAKPADLAADVEYGRATFKVDGDKLLIVKLDTLDSEEYENVVIKRGQAITKNYKDTYKANKKAHNDRVDQLVILGSTLKDDKTIHQLLTAGVKAEAIDAKVAEYIASLKVEDLAP